MRTNARTGARDGVVAPREKELDGIVIRAAAAADAPRVSRLLRSWSHTYTLSPMAEGAEAFLATLEVPAVAAFIVRSDVMYIVAESGEGFAGAAALRDHRSVEHLFVDAAYLGIGLGRRLWETLRDAALQAGNPGVFTVHSSVNAVPIYERFGFVVAGERIVGHGGVSVPMVLDMTRSTGGG